MTILRIFLLSTVFSIIPASIANTSSMTERELIHKGVNAYLLSELSSLNDDSETNITVEVSEIDKRIQIPACEEGFEYNAKSESLGQPYLSVRVNCRSSDWYLFTSAQVTRTRPIVVSSSVLSPGTVLTSANLEQREIDVNRLRHTAFDDANALIGARLKRRIREGSPILSNMLCFVCKGDRITIIAQASGMQVKTSGIAQQDGVLGDTIQVLNARSKKSVIAQVADTQTVVVNL